MIVLLRRLKDSSGQIFCSYSGPCFFWNSGPIDTVDSNGAEVYDMLMGCCELHKLDDYNVTIEGDSFSAIQWGSGNC